MPHADLTAAAWRDLSDESATEVARAIASENDLALIGVRAREYAGRRQRIAVFERDGLRFSLLPADRVTLGFDGHRFTPTEAQAESYADSVDEYDLPPLAEHVDAMTSPVRTVDLPAVLVGIEAFDGCRVDVDADDPRVQEVIAHLGPKPGCEITSTGDGDGVRIRFDQDGGIAEAQVIEDVTYADAVRRVTELGLRPASPDEWEYACGAGATTLFRWGDDCRGDRSPYDDPDGVQHKPNLWGLRIGQDSYRHEWTSEPTIVCGGDGGGTECGGAGAFLAWLTLATAYRDVDFGEWLNSPAAYSDTLLLRPAIDLK
ncbi:hypothetical protein [Kutzneria buriramensis]|uniref:Formylglycine-generating enzyme required for sulfatase activity n=1 Tax=Kutzneria buriramensis TaxID=1045776 RepID=A0A3E0GX61_9PSEU|nr:hypothetical protein [Kutzneria buriramensis]REH32980.1 hypothetical protein BCF44_12052 [Kutzneria buriramensis]